MKPKYPKPVSVRFCKSITPLIILNILYCRYFAYILGDQVLYFVDIREGRKGVNASAVWGGVRFLLEFCDVIHAWLTNCYLPTHRCTGSSVETAYNGTACVSSFYCF